MHNAAFAAAGLDAVYLPLPAADADDFLDVRARWRPAGRERDDPVQGDAGARTRTLDDEAARTSARVNTLRATTATAGARRTPTSTAFSRRSRPTLTAARLRARRCSAPAARRAPWRVALGREGAAVTRARAPPRAGRARRGIAGASSRATWPPPAGSWDLLVNSTPVGMHPRVDETPLPAARVRRAARLRPRLQPARRRGCCARRRRPAARRIGGLDMLVAQAQEQFQWWTGRRPDAGRDARSRRARLERGCRDCSAPLVGQRSSTRDEESRRSKNSRSWPSAARSCRSARRSSPTC